MARFASFTPGGRPLAFSFGSGYPVAVTVNGVMAVPAVTVSLLVLVMTGAWHTVTVTVWSTGEPMP